MHLSHIARLLQSPGRSNPQLTTTAPQCPDSAPCAGALQRRHLLLLQVGGDAILKALSAAEYNAPDAEASAPVLQGFTTVIR